MCGDFYFSSRTGSCIPLPESPSALPLVCALSSCRAGQEVEFLYLKHVDPPLGTLLSL